MINVILITIIIAIRINYNNNKYNKYVCLILPIYILLKRTEMYYNMDNVTYKYGEGWSFLL